MSVPFRRGLLRGADAVAHRFALSPILTRRRIATVRGGRSFCFRRHSSIAVSSGGCQRSPIKIPIPVLGGRPRVFLLSLIDRVMTT